MKQILNKPASTRKKEHRHLFFYESYSTSSSDLVINEKVVRMPAECPVCLDLYNIKEKKPKVLGCSHSVCSRCLETIIVDDHVECPTCRTTTDTTHVNINYGLLDAIADACEVCNKQVRDGKCHHCSQELCGSCLEEHGILYYDTVQEEARRLSDEVQQAIRRSMDRSIMEKEMERESEVLRQIKEANQKRKDELDRLEKELGSEIKTTSEENTNKHREWTNNLDSHIDAYRAFLRSSPDKLGTRYSKECTSERLAEVVTEVRRISGKIHQTRTDKPQPTDYQFRECGLPPMLLGNVTFSPHRDTDYRTAKSRATADGGADQDELSGRARLVSMDDSIIVTDCDIHGLRVYNSCLDFQFLFAQEGSGKHQFSGPIGICTIGGELFVSEENNHRIKVFAKNYQLLRLFGSKGTGKDEFDMPVGLSSSPDGQLYVCDANNYRVKVMTPDGTYVRSIGGRGTRPGEFDVWPTRVAVTSTGSVLVIDHRYLNVHTFTPDGYYTGQLVRNVPNTVKPLALRGIALSKNDTVILTDRDNHRMVIMRLDGEVLCTIGSFGKGAGQLNNPWDVAVNQQDEIIVYEAGNHRLQLFTVDK